MSPSRTSAVRFAFAAAALAAALALWRRNEDPVLDGGFFAGTWPDTGPVALGFWEEDGLLRGVLNREESDDGDSVSGIRLDRRNALLVVHRWVEGEDGPVGVARLWVHGDRADGDLHIERVDAAGARRVPEMFQRLGCVREGRAKLSLRIGAYGHRSTFRFPYPASVGSGGSADLWDSLKASVHAERRGAMGGLSEAWDGIRNPGFSGNEWEYLATPRLRRSDADLVSVLVETYPYRGGNGNWTRYAAWNRIRDDGKVRPLRLEELFREDGAWIRYLRTACAVELRRLGAAWPGEATAETDAEGGPRLPAPLEEQRFTLSATGLQLQFDPYEAGSGAQGGFSVHIPFSDLGRHLRPEWRRRLVR